MTFHQVPTKSSRGWIQQNGTRLLKLALVSGVILLSILAPYVISERQILLLIGAIGALAGVWLLLRWPVLGLLALIVTALLVPSPNLPGGLTLAVLLLIFLIGLWVLDMIVNKRARLIKSRPIKPLLALVLVACISFAFGQLGWFSYAQPAPLDAQVAGLMIFILSVGAFLIVAHQTDLRWLQALTFLFIGLSAVFILGWLVPSIGTITSRIYNITPVSNSMFWTWIVALTFGQAMFNRKLHIGWRIVLGLVLIMTLFVAYFKNSGWKAGYLPAMVSIAAIIGARSWRFALIIILLSIFPAIYLYSDAISTDEYSYLTRIEAFLIMLEIIKVSPILGLGPANYYFYTHFFPIRGYYIEFNSHNQYLDIMAQTGVLGLICFLWFGVEMAWLGLSLRDRAPEGFAQAYVYGAIGGLAGTFAAAMLVDWVIPFVYNIGLRGMQGSLLAWLFLGGLVSIEVVTNQQSKSTLSDGDAARTLETVGLES